MRVLVTRPEGQAQGFIRLLLERRIEVVHVPTVELVAADPAPLVAALTAQPAPSWLVITSANGATGVAEALRFMGLLPNQTRVAAVGPATAGALRAVGVRVDHVPDRFLTGEIATGLGDLKGRRVVLARADAATPELRQRLEAMAANVEEIIAYRTIEGPESSREPMQRALRNVDQLDLVTFTSGSTVRGLVALASGDPASARRAQELPGACIGPITAAEARRLGFSTPIVASPHTGEALAAAVGAFAREQEPVA